MPLNIDWQQILLHWMNLAILTGGLYFLLFEPVKQFMRKRADHYQELDKLAEDKLAQAEEQARHIVAKAKAEAEQTKERAIRESQKEMRELAAKAAKKLAAKPGEDFFDQFLDLTEGGKTHEGR